MRHLAKTTVSLMLLLLSLTQAQGQTVAQCDAALQEFVRLNNGGGNRADMYRNLYTCYTGFTAIVAANGGTPDYQHARESLRLVYPYLQSAAGYYSQSGNQQLATFFARACVDMPMMEAFQDEPLAHDDYYPTIVYFAASSTFNQGDYEAAVKYYNEYLKTGEQSKRKNAYTFLYKACQKTGNQQLAATILENAVANYPNDFDMLSLAINAAIERQDYVRLSAYVSKAQALRPNNQELLSIQGKMYEDTRDYENALKVYERLKQLQPRSLSAAGHVALNTYNLGVMNYNKAALADNKIAVRRLHESANDYFTKAAKLLQEVLMSDPTSVKYTQALAVCYSCTGNTKQLDATNFKLQALGSAKVEQSVTPALMAYNDKSLPTATAAAAPATAAQPMPATADSHTATAPGTTPTAATGEVPRYSVFARQYVEQHMKQWQQKDAFETVTEYKKRVNNESQKQKLAELQRQAERDYIRQYAHTPRYDELRLMPYDAENQVFLIRSDFGDLVLPVPRERGEARIFQSNWNGMQFRDAQYYIDGDSLALASLTFVTPTGNTYQYSNQQALEYLDTQVDVDLAQVDYENIGVSSTQGGNKTRISQRKVTIGTSDVDKDIPQSKQVNSRTFAVIIANENYELVPPVSMATSDGAAMAKYCRQTLGLPETNVRVYPDATLGSMINALQDIRSISAAYEGDVQIIFYYAGHGIPDEATKDAYLLPVDADGRQMATCYSLKKLYGELSTLGARNVVVFLDACFSGSTADGGNLMASARGVALKPKKEAPQGNMVVFSAASDAETAYPYEEKGHGMFTYYLLKKLKESKGNATLKELGDYIVKNVREMSVVVNRKAQTPTVTPSNAVADTWQGLKLK